MKEHLDRFTIDLEPGQHCQLCSVTTANQITTYDFSLSWTRENAAADHAFRFSWRFPINGIMYQWYHGCGTWRSILPDWHGGFRSMLSSGAPLLSCYDGNGLNRYTWALSECRKQVTLQNGIVEESGEILSAISLCVGQYTNQFETTLQIRIDCREIPFYDAIADTANWWAQDLGMTPAQVPAAATDPCYSFWYSYHQDITDALVEAECRRARALGFDTCIIDDGWQTDDNSRGYAFCGDWEPAPSKFPDMAAHVARVHEIGMKYIIWYGVAFVGFQSKHYPAFQDKLLRKIDSLNTGVLDPRFPEVRNFLLNIYKKALIDWNLDGFKLDFIDQWSDQPGDAPYREGMDIPALQDAVTLFMNTVITELKAIKPDIMLEFRQSYIGPQMRTFGNMFRVGDCPGDYIANRVGMFDLRMTMGHSAVHSDMLTWHPDEAPEQDALQIISVLYSVLQYSARLDLQKPATEKMSRFWLDFLRTHKSVLLDGKLQVYEPHLLYTWAQATTDDTCIATVYAIDKCMTPTTRDTMYLVNGSSGNRLLAQLDGTYQMTVLNCYGEELRQEALNAQGVCVLPVPKGGLAVLRRRSV